jgi:hypothetical protein
MQFQSQNQKENKFLWREDPGSKDLMYIKCDWLIIHSYMNAFISKYDTHSKLQTSWTNNFKVSAL